MRAVKERSEASWAGVASRGVCGKPGEGRWPSKGEWLADGGGEDGGMGLLNQRARGGFVEETSRTENEYENQDEKENGNECGRRK